jgi:signal transduction histidine kinase
VATRFHRPPLQWAWASAVTFGLTASLIVAVIWFALSRLIGPLHRLAAAADRLGLGEDVAEIAPTGPEELRRLTTAFNAMQARLTRMIAEHTRMLAALGHDLRSPLTAMRVRVEMVDDDETRERLIATLDEMQEMVEATLAFARGVASSEATETVDPAKFLRALIDDIAETGGTVTLDATPGSALRLRPHALRRALRNVIDNALRYGGRAAVRLERVGGTARITVSDDGPGIPEADLERVFEPFVRLETSRSRETGGSGLGLAIARTIIHAHGGDIRLANRPEGGLTATIDLPIDGALTHESR